MAAKLMKFVIIYLDTWAQFELHVVTMLMTSPQFDNISVMP